jgi:spoIIIJ-associated protein
MSDSKHVLESSGSDIDTAIRDGLARLNVTQDAVEVEILDEGARGVFGLGAREARVRLTVKTEEPLAANEETPAVVAAEDVPVEISVPELRAEPEDTSEEDLEATLGRDTLLELVSLMGMENMQVDVRRAEPAPDEKNPPLVFDIHGPEAEELVGRRGDTLAALQRIARLIVGRELSTQVRFVVDVGGFKERRKDTLCRLAKQLAKQAVDTDRTIVLEPMPPQERRVVHLALRDDPTVSTESVGEGDRRKVTIVPRG